MNQEEFDTFLEEVDELSLLQIHPHTSEDNIKKLLKVFKGMFIPFKINDDSEDKDGVSIFPAGP